MLRCASHFQRNHNDISTMEPNTAKEPAASLGREREPPPLTAAQEEMRLRGLRILARIIARRHLADAEVLPTSSRTDPNERRHRSDLKEVDR